MYQAAYEKRLEFLFSASFAYSLPLKSVVPKNVDILDLNAPYKE
jgi:hypothetical protein